MNFYQIMTLIAVTAFVILVIYAVITLLQVKKTAQSVEYLALTTAEKVDQTRSTFELLHNVSSLLDNGFCKALRIGVDLVDRYRARKEK